MEFIIKETNERAYLGLIDKKTGCEYTQDYMQVSSLDYIEEQDGDYIISKADYEWWKEVIEAQEELDELIELLKQNGVDEEDILNTMSMGEEMEYFAKNNIQYLTDEFVTSRTNDEQIEQEC